MQALERVHPSKPMRPGTPERIEFVSPRGAPATQTNGTARCASLRHGMSRAEGSLATPLGRRRMGFRVRPTQYAYVRVAGEVGQTMLHRRRSGPQRGARNLCSRWQHAKHSSQTQATESASSTHRGTPRGLTKSKSGFASSRASSCDAQASTHSTPARANREVHRVLQQCSQSPFAAPSRETAPSMKRRSGLQPRTTSAAECFP